MIVVQLVPNVRSDTIGSAWWDNIIGGARPRSSNVVWLVTVVFIPFCICQIHI